MPFSSLFPFNITSSHVDMILSRLPTPAQGNINRYDIFVLGSKDDY